ncbi:hypothetical protein C8Q73DRAFT_341116 [Cubamyces lactineus]|nr:hypothetical protein C8Q73DRAFT_341116 [Cubamyces lactineus]
MVGGKRYKFTDADKIFFIHYLEWRMQDVDPDITKSGLCEEVARYAPHHSGKSWMKHWRKHPQRADEIFSRGHDNGSAVPPPRASPGTFTGTPSTSSTQKTNRAGERTSELEGESTLGSDSGGSYKPRGPDGRSTADPSVAISTKKKQWRTRQMTMQKQAVTEADLRAMAQYRFEKYKGWPSYITCKERWRGFAERKENAARRSLLAWMAIERTHGKYLQAYFEELCQADAAARQKSNRRRIQDMEDTAFQEPANGNGIPVAPHESQVAQLTRMEVDNSSTERHNAMAHLEHTDNDDDEDEVTDGDDDDEDDEDDDDEEDSEEDEENNDREGNEGNNEDRDDDDDASLAQFAKTRVPLPRHKSSGHVVVQREAVERHSTGSSTLDIPRKRRAEEVDVAADSPAHKRSKKA